MKRLFQLRVAGTRLLASLGVIGLVLAVFSAAFASAAEDLAAEEDCRIKVTIEGYGFSKRIRRLVRSRLTEKGYTLTPASEETPFWIQAFLHKPRSKRVYQDIVSTRVGPWEGRAHLFWMRTPSRRSRLDGQEILMGPGSFLRAFPANWLFHSKAADWSEYLTHFPDCRTLQKNVAIESSAFQ